jgi:transglutaminase-like putative cysteine protease
VTVLSVRHVTRYRYAKSVAFGEHRMMFRPRDSFDQHVLESVLTITPRPIDIRYIHDAFGNTVGIARFGAKARELVFESINRLELHPENALDIPQADRQANAYPFIYDKVDEPDLAPSKLPIYPDPEGKLLEWAGRFLDGLTTVDAPHILAAMTLGIHDELKYEGRLSGPPQAPLDTLARGRGTCRDFAVLMMEAARRLGLAARFVSGYLYVPEREDGAPERKGGGNTHAWVRVFLPGGGWAEFDPTNGLVGNRDLIRVAVVRDPRQAVPLSGTWDGESADFLGMDVEVDVVAEAPGDTERKRVVRLR